MDYFNPLPPHGGRRKTQAAQSDSSNISIHSLRMEGDAADRPKRSAVKVFQSTPSAWRETNSLAALVRTIYISIHSLRMEGDSFCNFKNIANTISIHSLRMEGDVFFLVFVKRNFLYFNPLPPHGGRPKVPQVNFSFDLFQSTPSAWRETPSSAVSSADHSVFQSTPSAWRETCRIRRFFLLCDISIHSLRMEGDSGRGGI